MTAQLVTDPKVFPGLKIFFKNKLYSRKTLFKERKKKSLNEAKTFPSLMTYLFFCLDVNLESKNKCMFVLLKLFLIPSKK